MVRGRGTQHVDLVEDEPAPRAGRSRDAAGPRGPRWRRPWVAAAVGVVVVAAGLVGAQAVVDGRERDRLADARAVAGAVAGAVAPPPGELRVLWAAPLPPPRADGWHDPRTFAGLRTLADDSAQVVAVDAVTGAERWVLPLVAAPAERRDRAVGVGNRCAADGQRLVCLGSDVALTPPGAPEPVTATTSRLVVVDVPTGRVVTDVAARSADGVLAHTFALDAGRAVLVGEDAAGASHAWALDLPSGRPAWSVVLPVADAGPTAGLVGIDVPYTLADGTVAVAARDGSALVLDPADGRVVLGPVRGTSDVEVAQRLDGHADLALPAGDDVDVLRAAGVLRVPGRLLEVTVDDGSLPGVLLTSGGGRVRAVDAGTGAVRWATDVTLPNAAAVLDGRVHVAAATTLVTLDGRTGARLWERARATRTWSAGVLTDGTLLYEPRPATGAAGRPELVGLEPADGAEESVVTLPPDVWSAAPWGGRLVELGAGGVKVLG